MPPPPPPPSPFYNRLMFSIPLYYYMILCFRSESSPIALILCLFLSSVGKRDVFLFNRVPGSISTSKVLACVLAVLEPTEPGEYKQRRGKSVCDANSVDTKREASAVLGGERLRTFHISRSRFCCCCRVPCHGWLM